MDNIIVLFKENVNMSDKEWERLCKRYAHRNKETIIALMCEVCNKSPKAVKMALRDEFARLEAQGDCV